MSSNPNIPMPPGFSSAGDAEVCRISDAQHSDQNYKDDGNDDSDWVPGYPPPAPPE